jgi:hypothetical protein
MQLPINNRSEILAAQAEAIADQYANHPPQTTLDLNQ